MSLSGCPNEIASEDLSRVGQRGARQGGVGGDGEDVCLAHAIVCLCGGTIVARAEARADLHVGAHHLRQPAHVQARPSVTIYVLILLVVFGLC